MTIMKRVLLFIICMLFHFDGFSSSDDPDKAGGLSEPTLYHQTALDSINLYNGSLSVKIPLGGTYPLDSGFSYGFQLNFSSDMWHEESRDCGGPNNVVDFAEPTIPPDQISIGLGWRISPGPSLRFRGGDTLLMTRDGASHKFDLESGASVAITRDGSYFRLRVLAPEEPYSYAVDHPDGTISYFDTDGRVVVIDNAFGRRMLTYDYETPGTVTVTDSAGRVHTISSVTGSSKQLQLAIFGGGPPATYTFNVVETIIDRRGGGPVCVEDTVSVPLLNSIVLPDNSRYEVEYYTEFESTTSPQDPFPEEWGTPGHLKSITLPAGGLYEWRYEGSSATEPDRVLSKRIREVNNGPEIAVWRYRELLFPRRVIVRNPDGDESIHYFESSSVSNNEDNWVAGWFKGLPFWGDEFITGSRINHNLYLSSETWSGEVGTGTKLQSRYVRYIVDDPTLDPIIIFPDSIDQEPRLVASLTVDDDGYALETLKSDFDGFGKYRTMERWAVNATGDIFASTTNYNPHLSGMDEFSIPDDSWVLNTFNFVQTTYQGQTSRTEYCFDTENGFLERTRQLRDFGVTRSLQDVVTINTLELDSLSKVTGNVAATKQYGADITPLPAVLLNEDLCSISFMSHIAAQVPGFHENFTYTNGVIRGVDVINPITDDVALSRVDRTIDPNTGLLAIARSPSGVAKSFQYDNQGRLISESTPGLPTSMVIYCLKSQGCEANSVAKLISDGSLDLSNTIATYDGLGRKVSENFKSAKNATQTEELATLFAYDKLDRQAKRTVTKVNPSLADPQVTSISYDTLGRQTQIILPDGFTTTTDYAGIRSTTANYWVRTATGNDPFSRLTFSDGVQGVVSYVEEASGSGNSMVRTNYEYDVNNRLTSVTTGVQQRSFTYNNLGWLTSAVHPELSVSINNSQFDVLGNPHVTVTGSRTVLSNYDAAGRISSLVEQTTSGERLFEELFYADANLGSDQRAGKLVRVKRHNYLPEDAGSPESSPIHHYVVSERYRYDHPAGLLTDINTSVVAFDSDFINHSRRDVLFEQSSSFNTLGLLSDISYPSAIRVGGLADMLDLSLQYNMGQLVAVINVTDNITSANLGYSRGMLTSVVNGNLTEQVQNLDASGILRPASFSLHSGSNELWSTGEYVYGPSGNVTAIDNDTFYYDGVARLKYGTSGGLAQDIDYDQFGNITDLMTNGVEAVITVDAATNRLLDSAYSYDPYGNITQWNTDVIAYDLSNLAIASNMGGVPKQFIYAADNKRIGTRDVSTGEIHWTVRGENGKVLSEFQDTGREIEWTRDYLYNNASIVSARKPSEETIAQSYFHLDHLGSTRVVTDELGQVVAEYDYFPFGRFVFKSGSEADLETHLYTGHERDINREFDDDDDLDYMLARYYAPNFGRFLSVDPILGRAEAPQSWNRYTYAANNPVRLKDATGLAPTDGLAQIVQDVERMTGQRTLVTGVRMGFVADKASSSGADSAVDIPGAFDAADPQAGQNVTNKEIRARGAQVVVSNPNPDKIPKGSFFAQEVRQGVPIIDATAVTSPDPQANTRVLSSGGSLPGASKSGLRTALKAGGKALRKILPGAGVATGVAALGQGDSSGFLKLGGEAPVVGLLFDAADALNDFIQSDTFATLASGAENVCISDSGRAFSC